MDLQHDDALPFTGHTCTSVVPCSRHEALGTPAQIYAGVLADNRLKNDIPEELFLRVASLGADYLDSGGNTYKWFAPGIEYRWSLSQSRVLTIFLDGVTLTSSQRNQIQAALNTRFGTGKVILG